VQVYIPETGVGSLTDVDGRFLLLNVAPGEHRVTAQQVGYRAASQSVTVQPGQAAVLNLALNQMAITLDELVVTGAGVAVEKKKL
ncbi:MAG: carboxypeptidase-like regulatory domain-containing protein, partial [Gemmatimonadetes bacterium]|nr:carboxypeptidase-like regulatory domain-containing protein [Gemmatimonadota bacterium]NIS03077.1 carboxypeptidase-like regulatory domain-containing protein [Gemmatimonadota bacterium]NIT68815.1 carboxypeptidase-like regulatory domain-containing protein [Gemmatimonadota bacterium]NIV25460.1 PEGA domain-containing protein [Gemmatimonadota bacterium]NIY37392.1 PEGA domain-containing protein [Gemmatimonadota bacterium]